MPKTKPTDREERERITKAALIGNQTRYGVDDHQLAKGLGIVVETYRNKKNHQPGQFSLEDMQALAKMLKFTPIQAASVLLGRDLTAKEIKDFILM